MSISLILCPQSSLAAVDVDCGKTQWQAANVVTNHAQSCRVCAHVSVKSCCIPY